MAPRSRLFRLRPESAPRFAPPRARCCTRPLTRPSARPLESLRRFLPTSASLDLNRPCFALRIPGATLPGKRWGLPHENVYLTLQWGIHSANGAMPESMPTGGVEDDGDR